MMIGLRIDVDTFRGTRYGVPNLCKLLDGRSIKASFFFSVGPDNMGRHLWRMLSPSFFWKMLRTRASSLYGWNILLKGTFWSGPVIGETLGNIIRYVSDEGHEVGLHAWDHHAWQVHIDRMSGESIRLWLKRGAELFTQILGRPPVCSAAPAWKCNDLVLMEKAKFSFVYNRDCRGETIFRPLVDGRTLSPPQIPVTLPTYDEVIGFNGISISNYNDFMLSLLQPEKLNVLTIHAEVEGISCLEIFDLFLKTARSRGASFVPLGSLLKDPQTIGSAAIMKKEIPGREGWISWQASVNAHAEIN